MRWLRKASILLLWLGLASATVRAEAPYPELALDSNTAVRRWLRTFLAEEAHGFRSLLVRASPYKAMVETVFREEGLPPQFFYLALIESGYLPQAKSHRGALGIWQFTPATAAIYGLNRRHTFDPCRSTRAAARHLAYLYDQFGSWHLAIAAYNAGETRLRAAIERGRTRHFWTLARRRLLPAQTAQYVPKFLAAATLGENLERFGIDTISPGERRVAPCHVD